MNFRYRNIHLIKNGTALLAIIWLLMSCSDQRSKMDAHKVLSLTFAQHDPFFAYINDQPVSDLAAVGEFIRNFCALPSRPIAENIVEREQDKAIKTSKLHLQAGKEPLLLKIWICPDAVYYSIGRPYTPCVITDISGINKIVKEFAADRYRPQNSMPPLFVSSRDQK